ncbi:MAG: hypothetical protein IT450_14255 [Phycisphaerales bacterium]|nr:hypothetical protein [Phycisphaerales bacterium]
MMADEKQLLLNFFNTASTWCQHVEARDLGANPVHCDDDAAAAWDITGAMYRLFGSRRAGALFAQLDRHIHGKRHVKAWPVRSPELDAMVALQAFNDASDTTFEVLRLRLETAPVWSGGKRSIESESVLRD